MKSRRGAGSTVAPTSPLEDYQRLRLPEIMADLPSLDLGGLRLVRYLEQSGQARPEILDTIADLVAATEATGEADPPASLGGVDGLDRPDHSAGSAPSLDAAPGGSPGVGTGLARRIGRRGRGRGAAASPIATSPPRRARRRGSVRLAQVAAGVVIVAVAGAGASMMLRRNHPSGGSASPSPVHTNALTGSPLAPLVLATVPAGYNTLPDSAAGAGPLDMSAAAKSAAVANASAVLARAGFEAGFERSWKTADQRQITVYLYKFSAAAGATSYSQQLATATRSSAHFTDLAIAAIPGAVGLTRATGAATSDGVVVFAKGQYVVRLLTSGTATVDHTTAQQLAQTQYARL